MPLLSILGIFGLTYSTIAYLVSKYGYYAIFGLTALEAASIPIPSELVLPLIGYFIFEKILDPFLSMAVVLSAEFVGMAINYYTAYFIGKDIVYKHLQLFHIKKETLDAFDVWFARNGSFAVFISRLMPVVRGLINFPAGFALMPQKKFYAYSMLGTALWDLFLISFGYYLSKYALSMQNAGYAGAVVGIGAGLVGILLFAIYRYFVKKIKK